MNDTGLKHFASLWTLRDYPNGSERGEWSDAEKFAAVKAAGFDGIQCSASPELASLAASHALTYLGSCDADATNYHQRLAAFAPLKPLRINVQLCNHDTEPAEAASVWIGMMETAADLGLEIDLEVHRDTCTETPEKTWRIAELYQQRTGQPLRFNFDLSHFAVVKHLGAPYAARLLDHPGLLQLSRQMHLRPFNGHHCQIPVTDGQGQITESAKSWLDFVEAAFSCWLEGRRGDEPLWVCPELGPYNSTYWIAPFPDPWKDAIIARDAFEQSWRKVIQGRPRDAS